MMVFPSRRNTLKQMIRLWPLIAIVIVFAPTHSSKAEEPLEQPSRQAVKAYLGITPEVEIGGLKGEFNEWIGYLDGKVYDAKAGYEFQDPSIGELFVSDHPVSLGDRYETPTHSGPIKITSEHNGVLTIRTIVGSFNKTADDAGDESGLLKITQVKTFYFDLRTRKFIAH